MNSSLENGNQPTSAAEKAPSILDKGRERRERTKKNIEKAKGSIASWWARAKATLGSGVETASAAVWATPEIASAAYSATEKKIDQFEDAVVFGSEVAGRAAELGAAYANFKIDQGVEAIDKKVTQMSKWTEDRIEDGKNVAKIAALVTVGMGYAAKEEVKHQVNVAKEKVKSGWRSLMEFGAKSLEAAQAKIKGLQDGATNKINEIKLSAAKSRLEVLTSLKGSLDSAVESSKMSVEEKQAKIVNLEAKINLQSTLMDQQQLHNIYDDTGTSQ